MKKLIPVITCFLMLGCGSDHSTHNAPVQSKLTRNQKEAKWVLTKRWVNDTLKENPKSLKLIVDQQGNIDINGHKTTYELLHEDRYLHFVYVYEDTHEYYLDILHLSDTAFIYELRNCEFQTVKEKLIPYED